MAFSVKDPGNSDYKAETGKITALKEGSASVSVSESATDYAGFFVPEKKSPRYCPDLPEIFSKARRAVLTPWSAAILVLALIVVGLAYQGRPAYDIALGGGFDTPYLNLSEDGFGAPVQVQSSLDSEDGGESSGRNSDSATTPATNSAAYKEELNQNYRWTRERPILLLPGIGAAPTRLTLTASGSTLVPAGQRVEMLLNGQPFTTFDLKAGVPLTRSFDIGSERITGGNLTVEMRVKPLGPPNLALAKQYPATFPAIDKINGETLYQGQTGFKLYSARVEAQPGASGLVMPPLSIALAVVASAWLLYLGLAYAGVAPLWAFAVAALITLGMGVALAIARLSLTIYTGRLALLLAVTLVMLPLLDWAVPRLLRRWKLPLPKWAWQGLLVMFLVGMIGRGGGLLYPHTEVLDAPYHLREINTVLHEPDGINKELHRKDLSKVPAQWESDAIIPYSPFVYFYLAPVAALPVDPSISVNLFNALLDAVRVFIIFALAAALGAGARASLVAAGIYLITPSTWLLNQWGNWPTTVSLWLGTLYLLLVLVAWQKLNRPWVWVGTTFVLLLTMLGYTVTAVFIGMILYGWALGLVLFSGRKDPLARRNGWLIAGANTAAALLALLIYYGQFIPDMAKTFTTFGNSLETKGSLGSFGDRSLTYYLGLYTDHVVFRYGAGAFIAIALVVFGWMLFSKQPRAGEQFYLDSAEPNGAALRSGKNLWLAGMWIAVFVFFGLAQWKVDMVDKQVWLVVPLASALAGVGICWAWQRYQAPALQLALRALISLLVTWTVYSALTLWIYRVFIKRR
ncbi:MAG TPA: hypothetical protein VH186_06885 [Chloroflexia bacterium]|nr:hypothetical protein [Chloroflexia bacterium]